MSYLFEYLTFLAEVVTIVVAILVIIAAAVNMGAKQHARSEASELIGMEGSPCRAAFLFLLVGAFDEILDFLFR